jgi:hypothetical protein
MHLVALVEPICTLDYVGMVLGSAVAGHGNDLLVLNSSVSVPILSKTLGTDCSSMCSHDPVPCCAATFAGRPLGCRIALGCTLLVHLLKFGNVLIDLVNRDGAGALFVKHAKHGLVLLLVNCKLLLI